MFFYPCFLVCVDGFGAVLVMLLAERDGFHVAGLVLPVSVADDVMHIAGARLAADDAR